MIGDMSARAPRTALPRLAAAGAAAALVLAACSSDDTDERTDEELPDIVAVYDEDGQSDGGSATVPGHLVVDGDCLVLDDGSGYRSIPAFSSAGEPYWDGEVLIFDGRDYDIREDGDLDDEEPMGFQASFPDEEDDSALTIPDGCSGDLDVVLIHATSAG